MAYDANDSRTNAGYSTAGNLNAPAPRQAGGSTSRIVISLIVLALIIGGLFAFGRSGDNTGASNPAANSSGTMAPANRPAAPASPASPGAAAPAR
jgi:hypothetical protein